MEIAILGLKMSGKSSLFRIMTGVDSSEFHGEPLVKGMANIPDSRFDRLVEIFKPAKVTPVSLPFIDVNVSGEKGWDSIRQTIAGVDSIIHIIDCFISTDASGINSNYRKLEDELILSDLIVIERRIERLEKIPAKTVRTEESTQMKILPAMKAHLEAGNALRDFNLSEEEKKVLKNFSFWSIRPELVVLNTAEGSPAIEGNILTGTTSPAIPICCKVEQEIAVLPKEERKEFLDAMGITEPAFQKIIREAFKQQERIYYFTVGEDEVRAWSIRNGTKAPQAAGVIHKDFEKGFIKAEVVGYEDFISSGTTLVGAKAAGKMRLEGKDYVVHDGDIISFRFNV